MKSRYIRLLRPVAWITFLFPFSVGIGIGMNPNTNLIHVMFAFYAFTCWMSFCFIVNAFGDKDVDKFHNGRSKDMNLANQPIATGEFNEKEILFLSILFLLFSLLFALIINCLFFMIIVVVNIFGFVYSMPPIRFKAKPVGDILSNAISAGAIFTAGISVGGSNINILIILEAIIMASIFYLPTVLTDLEFDKKMGLRTSAVYFGPRKILLAMYLQTIFLIIVGLIIYLQSNIELKILVLLMIVYTLIFIFAAHSKLKGETLYLHENWILIPFTVLSAAFVIYGIIKYFGWIVINS